MSAQLETILGTGATSPSGELVFKMSLNGGAYADIARLVPSSGLALNKGLILSGVENGLGWSDDSDTRIIRELEDTLLFIAGNNSVLKLRGAVVDKEQFIFSDEDTAGNTASTEVPIVQFGMTGTKTWATGALATQNALKILAPTYAFVGASTITDAATLYINQEPQAGTNATITNPYALWVDSGVTRLDGVLDARSDATVGGDATVTGDIDAAGGFRQTLEAVYIAGDSSSSYTLAREGSTSAWFAWFVMPRAGSVVGLSTWMSADLASGSLEFWVQKSTDGGDTFSDLWGTTGTGAVSMSSGGDNERAYATVAKDTNTFAAGDILRVRVTYAASTAGDAWAQLQIEN